MPIEPDSRVNRRELGALWLDAKDAARELGVTVKSITATIGPLLTRESRSLQGRGARCVGYAYAREDIERCKVIMTCVGWSALEAAKILWAIRHLSSKGKLRALETQLSAALPIDLHGRVKAKRRRQ
jgi:hypothetical protein